MTDHGKKKTPVKGIKNTVQRTLESMRYERNQAIKTSLVELLIELVANK